MSDIERRKVELVTPEEWAGDRRQPWDRLDDESKNEFNFFRGYLSLGKERSLRKLSGSCGETLGRLQRLSSRHSWMTRVAAWDEEQDRLALVELEGNIIAMRQRHADTSVEMFEKITEAIRRFDPAWISGRDLPGWVEAAAKLERLSRGLTDTKRVEVTGKDGGPITVANELTGEQRRELMRAAQAELNKRLGDVVEEEILEGEVVDE